MCRPLFTCMHPPPRPHDHVYVTRPPVRHVDPKSMESTDCLPLSGTQHVRGAQLAGHISLGHLLYANAEQIRTFSGVSQVLVPCTKNTFPKGGGGG